MADQTNQANVNNFREVIDAFDKMHHDKTALQEIGKDKNIIKWTYGEFARDIRNMAQYYTEKGLAGKHIGICAGNCYEWLVYVYGGYYAGCVMVLMHYDLPDERLLENMGRADVELLITDRDFETMTDIPVLKINDEFPKAATNVELAPIDEKKRACMLFTSGTTGIEKMVELSQKNLMGILVWLPAYKKEKPIVVFSVFPFSHTGSFALLVSFYAGNIVCFQQKPKYFFRDLKIFSPHMIATVPTHIEAITKKVSLGQDIRDIVGENCYQIAGGGAVIRPELVKQLNKYKIVCANGYGQTESGGCGCVSLTGIQEKEGSVGKPNIEMKVEDGEILMRGSSVMLGYYKDEEATRNALKDGWLHTGDMGYIDEEGYVFLTGRKNSIINLSNGKKVSPEEIESRIMKCDLVNEILVQGEDNLIKAVIYAAEDSKDAIRQFIKEYNSTVESYKRIQRIEFSDRELPKTVSGKIKRN